MEFAFKGDGYTLAAALIMIAILSIFMAMALPLWSHIKQREMEEELIFRGKEYVEAIARYHQKFHSYPPDLETLEEQKFIRKLYKDPMTESGKWKVLHPDSLVQTGAAGEINVPGQEPSKEGDSVFPEVPELEEGESGDSGSEGNSDEAPEVESTGPVVGVVSRSKKKSIRVYNNLDSYDKWVFSFAVTQESQQPQDQKKDGKQAKPGSEKKTPEGQKNRKQSDPPSESEEQ